MVSLNGLTRDFNGVDIEEEFNGGIEAAQADGYDLNADDLLPRAAYAMVLDFFQPGLKNEMFSDTDASKAAHFIVQHLMSDDSEGGETISVSEVVNLIQSADANQGDGEDNDIVTLEDVFKEAGGDNIADVEAATEDEYPDIVVGEGEETEDESTEDDDGDDGTNEADTADSTDESRTRRERRG